MRTFKDVESLWASDKDEEKRLKLCIVISQEIAKAGVTISEVYVAVAKVDPKIALAWKAYVEEMGIPQKLWMLFVRAESDSDVKQMLEENEDLDEQGLENLAKSGFKEAEVAGEILGLRKASSPPVVNVPKSEPVEATEPAKVDPPEEAGQLSSRVRILLRLLGQDDPEKQSKASQALLDEFKNIVTEENEALRSENKRLKQEAISGSTGSSELQAELQKSQTEVARLVSEKESLNKDYALANDRVRDLREALDQASSRVAQLIEVERELASVKERLASVEEEKDYLAKKVTLLEKKSPEPSPATPPPAPEPQPKSALEALMEKVRRASR